MVRINKRKGGGEGHPARRDIEKENSKWRGRKEITGEELDGGGYRVVQRAPPFFKRGESVCQSREKKVGGLRKTPGDRERSAKRMNTSKKEIGINTAHRKIVKKKQTHPLRQWTEKAREKSVPTAKRENL